MDQINNLFDVLEIKIKDCSIPKSRGFGDSKTKKNVTQKPPMTALITPKYNIYTKIVSESQFTKKYPEIIGLVQAILKESNP